MSIQESGEMYLETILILSQTTENVRSVDVSDSMGFSRPSVSRAIGLLRDGGYLTVSPEGFIKLTEPGLELAASIYERHNIITECLKFIGVDDATAASDACRIEHVISKDSFQAIKNYININKKNPDL